MAIGASTLVAQPTVKQTVQIPVVNPSFEADVLSAPGTFTSSVQGWITSANSGKGTYRPEPGDFLVPIPDGLNVAYVNLGPNPLLQTTTETIEEGATYTLRVEVGNRTDAGLADYRVSLESEGEVLAQADRPATPDGEFVTALASFTAGPEQAGRPLTIRLDSLTDTGLIQVNFDHVRLIKERQAVAAVPTASGLGLFLFLWLMPVVGVLVLHRYRI